MQDKRADRVVKPASDHERARADAEAGGETACFAQMLCPECGVVLDGSPHNADCKLGSATARG